jgi:O-antigen ligase
LETINITEIKTFINYKLEEESISYFFASICIVLIPLYTWYIPPFVALWCIARIVEIYFNRNRGKITVIDRTEKKLVFLFILFFLLQVSGLLYSENIKNGLDIVLSRLSLLIFPILFILPGKYIDKNRKRLLRLFAGATTIYIVFCFVYALVRSVSLNNGQITINTHPPQGYWLSYFFGSFFSANQHPSYVAIFVILSIVIIFESVLNKAAKWKEQVLWIVSILILFTSLYFLSSRMALIIILIIIPIFLYQKLKVNGRILIVGISTVILLLLGFSIIRTNDRINYYINQMTEGSIKEKLEKDSRIMIWKSSLEIIKENPLLGVGIGDVRDELMKKYDLLGDKDLITSRYNAHNQFLEIAIEGGVISLLLFIMIIGFMFLTAIKTNNNLLISFLIIMIIFFLVETVIYRLAGVVFFSLFSFLLINIDSVSE